MTETAAVAVVAITNVTFDGRRYRPGAAFELPAPCAHALAAAGNVRRDETAHPDDDSGTGEGAGPAADAPAEPAPPGAGTARDTRPNRSHADTGGLALEEVSGIGPSTAERLRSAGVADVAALAALSDEELAQLRIRAGWRDQALSLIG